MKHLGFFLVAMLIATSACNKAGDPEEGGVTIEKGRLAFILPDAGRAVTYATTGEGAENGADNDLLGIFIRKSRIFVTTFILCCFPGCCLYL